MRRARALLATVLPAVLAAALAAAPESASADEHVRRDVAQALAQRNPRERIDGVQAALRDTDSADAADVIVQSVLDPEAPQAMLDVGVRALSKMDSEGARTVLAAAVPKARRERAVLLAEAFGKSKADYSRDHLRTMAASDDVRVRAAAVTALGDRREETCAGALAAALEDREWTVRSAAIRGLLALGGATAQAVLAERAGKEEGRLSDDLVSALRKVGLPKGMTLPAPGAASFRSPLVAVRSKRILFVLSTSETMKDAVFGAASEPAIVDAVRDAGKDLAEDLAKAATKIEVARVHLRTMLRTLADGVEFDVMTYSGSPDFAFGGMTAADDASRRKAEARVSRLSPGGVPDVRSLLLRIFDPRGKDPLDAPDAWDTVVLLSDGALPTGGFDDRTELAPRAVRWNRSRQIRFVSIGVGQSEPYLLGALSGGPPPGLYLSVP